MQAEYYKGGIAVFGNTKPWKENLKAIGGSFNKNLDGRAGWVFRKADEATVMQLIANANAGVIQPMTAAAPQVGAIPVAQPQMVPMGLVQPAMTPQAAMTRLVVAAPVQPVQPRTPIAVPMPEIGTRSPLLTLGFPTAARARDGLVYQIVMYTVPMPSEGQKLILKVRAAELNYTVAAIVAAASPAPIEEILVRHELPATAEPGAQEQEALSRAILSEGKWQIQGLHDDHTITFLPMQ